MDNLFVLLVLASLVLLVIGLINPKTSLFWYKKERTKKKSSLIYGGLTVLFFILFGISSDAKKEVKSNDVSQTTVTTSPKENVSSPTPRSQDDISKIEAPKEELKEEKSLPDKTYLLGDEIIFDNYSLKVTDWEQKSSYDQYILPKEGNKMVAVQFLMNNTSNETVDFNALEFSLFDENSDKYTTVNFGFKEPYFNAGDIQPGRKQRGWITFEVPKSSKKFEVKYTPGLFTGHTDYFIRLYKD